MTFMPICFYCAHYKSKYFCKAFPDGGGIPTEILEGEHNHLTEYPGDNGIMFQAKDDDDLPEYFSQLVKKDINES